MAAGTCLAPEYRLSGIDECSRTSPAATRCRGDWGPAIESPHRPGTPMMGAGPRPLQQGTPARLSVPRPRCRARAPVTIQPNAQPPCPVRADDRQSEDRFCPATVLRCPCCQRSTASTAHTPGRTTTPSPDSSSATPGGRTQRWPIRVRHRLRHRQPSRRAAPRVPGRGRHRTGPGHRGDRDGASRTPPAYGSNNAASAAKNTTDSTSSCSPPRCTTCR